MPQGVLIGFGYAFIHRRSRSWVGFVKLREEEKKQTEKLGKSLKRR